jgi:hypothetical protein
MIDAVEEILNRLAQGFLYLVLAGSPAVHWRAIMQL